MSTDEYVPDEETARWQYVAKRMHDGATRTHAEREYPRWLAAHDARVRRDAAREALDDLADDFDLWETVMPTAEVARRIRHERDTIYRKEEA